MQWLNFLPFASLSATHDHQQVKIAVTRRHPVTTPPPSLQQHCHLYSFCVIRLYIKSFPGFISKMAMDGCDTLPGNGRGSGISLSRCKQMDRRIRIRDCEPRYFKCVPLAYMRTTESPTTSTSHTKQTSSSTSFTTTWY